MEGDDGTGNHIYENTLSPINIKSTRVKNEASNFENHVNIGYE